jgi:hypothetical protein
MTIHAVVEEGELAQAPRQNVNGSRCYKDFASEEILAPRRSVLPTSFSGYRDPCGIPWWARPQPDGEPTT